ncbi:FmdB family zinc ribbon protein [Amycolatopsis sp. 195334CR]|uniref:FmdB family zinc ribbon protein n=1 Tax=Amycolatopsis sp. 195334CR TaxID=2814588 RepID=UPI001A8D7169|nr:FmdB family zinc ribbon protein [Amycolatopsis sp. 195334CR]MBN6034717.1 FmdB family transcriptional regulator [Amycolatopsis sp. 195334CR]
MPTYQYACKECDHRFEAVQSFSEDSLTECPQCTGPLRKLYGAVGVIFKGSGFYRNDSRSDSKSSSKSGSKPAETSAKSDSSKSDSSSSSSSSSSSTTSSTSSSSSSSSSSTTTKTAAAS